MSEQPTSTRIQRMMQRHPLKGAFVNGGLEVLDIPLNRFYEPPRYWEPGPSREMHEYIGDLNYTQILKYLVWLMQQKLHPEHASEPIVVTLADLFAYKVSGGFVGASIVDGDLVLLDYSPRVWANYNRFSFKPLTWSVQGGDFDNRVPVKSRRPIDDATARRAYQKLVTLGQSVWRLARASMLIDINWVEPSLVEFQSGRPIVWETRAVVVHKDFPTFAPTATTNTVTEMYTYQDDIVGS